MSSVSDALAVAALLLALTMGIALRGKVLGRRRTLEEAEQLLRCRHPNGDLGWSIVEWDWAFKEVGTAKAFRRMAAHAAERPA